MIPEFRLAPSLSPKERLQSHFIITLTIGLDDQTSFTTHLITLFVEQYNLFELVIFIVKQIFLPTMTIGEGEALQIASTFILFLASFIGVSIPFAVTSANMKAIVPFVNALAAGVMLGLALVSNLASSSISLSNLSSTP